MPYFFQTPCCIYFQVKKLRQLQQVSHLFCIHSILQKKKKNNKCEIFCLINSQKKPTALKNEVFFKTQNGLNKPWPVEGAKPQQTALSF